MQFSSIVYEGITYEFEPPVDTGEHSPSTLAQIVALAMKGADAPAPALDMGEMVASLTLRHTETDVATTLNALLRGKHQVTVRQ